VAVLKPGGALQTIANQATEAKEPFMQPVISQLGDQYDQFSAIIAQLNPPRESG
jgi:hypothetical protein